MIREHLRLVASGPEEEDLGKVGQSRSTVVRSVRLLHQVDRLPAKPPGVFVCAFPGTGLGADLSPAGLPLDADVASR